MTPVVAFFAQYGSMISAIGSVISAVGVFTQASRTSQIAEYNARVAEQNAAQAEQLAAVQEQRHRQQVSRILGEQETGYAKSGVDSVGTPLLVAEETTVQGELDALMIRYQGAAKANAYRSQAAMARYEGQAALSDAPLKAAGTLLGGLGRAADQRSRETMPTVPTYSSYKQMDTANYGGAYGGP